MSGWMQFRKTWLKPEVYPLVGAMTAAIGICGYAIYNKTRCTTVSWNKSRRLQDAGITHKDEVVPVLTAVRGNSTSIFSSDRSIFEAQYRHISTEPKKFTIRLGGEEEEEEVEPELEEEQAPTEVEEPAAEEASESISEVVEKVVEAVEEAKGNVTESQTDSIDLLAIKDEKPEVVQAAVDAALDVLKADEAK